MAAGLMSAQPTGGPPTGGGTPIGVGTMPTGGGAPMGGGTAMTLTGVTIGPYSLQSSYRYSDYQYNYTFTTSIVNANTTAYSSVLGTVVSSSANTVVLGPTVEFGNVPASASVPGLTTFTIRQDRRYAFDPTSLTWTFSGAANPTSLGVTPSSVSLSVAGGLVSYGTGSNLTAVVSPASGTGTVIFYDGPTALGTAKVSSGTATLPGFVLPAGKHDLSAVYSGDTTYASSSSAKNPATVLPYGAVANCADLSETAQVVCLAQAFEATLTSAQLAALQLSYTLPNVEHWSNLPLGIIGRNGLQFSTLTSTQLAAALQLVQAAMSPQGYARLQFIRGADDILNAANSGLGWGSGNYFIAFYGSPSTVSRWMLQVNGHHIALNHTFNGASASATPYFIGTEPVQYGVGQDIYLPMDGPLTAAYGLTQSVYRNGAALLSGTFDDVVMGVSGSTSIDTNYPQSYPSGTTGRGVLFTALTPDQQTQVKAMIEAWVTDMDSTTAAALLSAYEDPTALANTYVGYAGGGTLTVQGDYIRIDGPRVWVEFCVQNGIAWPASYHFHTIWRDKTADYGADFVSQ